MSTCVGGSSHLTTHGFIPVQVSRPRGQLACHGRRQTPDQTINVQQQQTGLHLHLTNVYLSISMPKMGLFSPATGRRHIAFMWEGVGVICPPDVAKLEQLQATQKA